MPTVATPTATVPLEVRSERTAALLDPGFNLTLRPMRYPQFYDMYRDAIRNTWTVEEIDFSDDVVDLQRKLLPAERHLIHRLVAFFATGDSIVSNNLVLNLYKHINSPEGRMYLSRQLYEEALHVQFYLTLLDSYIPDQDERAAAFAAIDNIPSIAAKGEFCFRWIDSINSLETLETREDRHAFLLNLICFAACIEGLFFYGAFAYVYFLRSKGLLNGLASGTNWVFRDESCVREGTEILTEDGWKPFEDLTGEELVAQFDQITESISFVRPARVIRKRHSGGLVVFSNRKGGVHQALTPDHDVVQRWEYQDVWSKKKAGEYVPNGKKLLPVAGHAVGDRDRLTDLDRFLIAVQADGTLPQSRYTGARCGSRPITFTLKKRRKIERLRKLIANCGWEHSEGTSATGSTTFRVSVPISVTASKYLKDWVRLGTVSSNWCAEFIEELAEWDGSHRAEAGSVAYSSIIRENVETVQAIAALCGQHASLGHQVKAREDGGSYEPIWRTTIRKTGTVRGGRGLRRSTEQYDGMVYCVSVPTGAIVIRSEGKVSVTGNCHMNFAFAVIEQVRAEEPDLFDDELAARVTTMIREAVDVEHAFAKDVLSEGVAGMSVADTRLYLEYVADQRLAALGIAPVYHSKNPFGFMELQDVQELTNFFERTASAYQTSVEGEFASDMDF